MTGVTWPSTYQVSGTRPPLDPLKEKFMKRRHVNKADSASKFRSNVNRTKKINIFPGPMRGGIRL